MENPDGARLEAEEHSSPKLGDLPEGLVLVSSGSEAEPHEEQDEEEEQEEGEIRDDDDEEEEVAPELGYRAVQQLDLEDISSEEESNIRQRMAALEAMDKEVGMIKKISSRSAYDYLSDDEDMYGKENYVYYYKQRQPQRNANSNNYTATKSSVGKKQDNRRDAPRRERTTTERIAPKTRHFVKAKEKVKRSSHKKHRRRKHGASSVAPPQRRPLSSDSEPDTTVDREYLKIACAIEKGRKSDLLQANKNALKDKLLLLSGSRGQQQGEKTIEPVIIDSSSSEPEVDAEEQDELQLRLLALSTKPKAKECGLGDLFSDMQVPSPPPPPLLDALKEDDLPLIPFETDGYRSEERELRLIALKSAILKKHQTRQKRKEQDAERPYSPSDDIVLAPVLAPQRAVYDELENDVCSVGKESVEIIDDDNDVLIVETPCELIALDDTDEEGVAVDEVGELEDGRKDMEISSIESPTLDLVSGKERSNECYAHDMTEDSQQPIDMELASSSSSSESSSEPFTAMYSEGRPNDMLLIGVNSCDSDLFTRREKPSAQSPPMTPDSMEEAEAEALRHLLLTKMRQKQSQKTTQVQLSEEVPINDPARTHPEDFEPSAQQYMPSTDGKERRDVVDPLLEEQPWPNVTVVAEHVEQQATGTENSMLEPRTSAQVASQTINSNLITLVNRTGTVRKRRKKSQTIKPIEGELETTASGAVSKVLAIAPLPYAARPEPLKAALIRTQKLVNNPNKLINLNQTISPSPPATRTDSPNNVDTFVSRPVAKLVIQLGNSDSDSDVDFGSPSPAEEAGVLHVDSSTVPTVRFEEQLDRFLKSVRSKTSVPPGVVDDSTKDSSGHSGNNSTMPKRDLLSAKQLQPKGPLKKSQSFSTVPGNATVSSAAVKHLPKSSQMEYMRLVARMAQLEQHKQARQRGSVGEQKTVSAANPDGEDTLAQANKVSARDQMISKSPGRRKHLLSETQAGKTSAATEVNPLTTDPMERKLQQIRSSIPNLSEATRNRLLLTAEKQLEKHSGTFLLELEEHNATIVTAQQERRELYQIDSRIELMRYKLTMLERSRAQQWNRSVDIFTSLQASRRKILSSRKRASELERMCNEIGHAIVGEEYQLPSSPNGPVLQEQLKILATETRQLRAIRKPTLDEFKEQMLANHRRKLMVGTEGTTLPVDDDCNKAEPYTESDREKTEQNSLPMQQNPQEAECGVPMETAEEEPVDQGIASPCEEDKPRNQQADQREEEEVKEEGNDVVQKRMEPEVCNSGVKHQIESTIVQLPATATDVVQSVNEKKVTESSAPGIAELMAEANRKEILIAESAVEERALSSDLLPDKTGALDEGATDSELNPNEPKPFGKYTSPLLSFKQGVHHIPSGVLCPYELGGQCVDRECKFDHFAQE